MQRNQRRLAAKSGNEALCDVAASFFARGRPRDAVERYQQALTIDPHFTKAYNELANIHMAQGRVDKAVELLKRAIEVSPGSSELFNALGNALRRKGQVAGALQLYQHATVLNSNYAIAYNNLGSAFLSLGKPENAICQFRHALRLAASFIGARLNLASALVDAGSTREALLELEIAYYASDATDFPLPAVGILFARCGNIARARDCFIAHLNRAPGDRELMSFLLAGIGMTTTPSRASDDHLKRIYDVALIAGMGVRMVLQGIAERSWYQRRSSVSWATSSLVILPM